MLIAEALAEIKTIGKRIQKKQDHVIRYLARQDALKDPLEKEGGSVASIQKEMQAIGDLNDRLVALRIAIQRKNLEEFMPVSVGDKSIKKTIAEWLSWRKECAPTSKSLLSGIIGNISNVRDQAQKRGVSMVQPGSAGSPNDVVVCVKESEISKSSEELEEILGLLDGQLSVKNATVHIDL